MALLTTQIKLAEGIVIACVLIIFFIMVIIPGAQGLIPKRNAHSEN